MSAKIFTPVNQVRFTNVAIVRLQKGGKRFEVACYKNKVQEWRKKVETSLDEVLQTPTIFSNTSKGVAAKRGELKKCFGTIDETKIATEILDKGQVQVSGDERKHELETAYKDIAAIVAEKCVHPETQRPLTAGMVEKAMRDIHYSVNPSQNAKKQALEVIKRLQKEKPDFPIARANMRLKISLPKENIEKLKEDLKDFIVVLEEEKSEDNTAEIVFQIIQPVTEM
eukprot:TRINITY_DN12511_c0_g1_i2.p1 TRINITY_DN12511_c0_g1~~TRINITY_DN12511_c0_g1_i2.p1  ORF type:complete len:226 (+),score=55.58 TRINITY_DN12511_c0_g1_i2:45-722(+)